MGNGMIENHQVLPHADPDTEMTDICWKCGYERNPDDSCYKCDEARDRAKEITDSTCDAIRDMFGEEAVEDYMYKPSKGFGDQA